MMQGFLLGALSVLLVDGACRAPLLAAEPGLTTLIKLCSKLPGYSQPWQGERRILAARTLCSCIQRDSHVRQSLIISGHLLLFFPTAIQDAYVLADHLHCTYQNSQQLNAVMSAADEDLWRNHCCDSGVFKRNCRLTTLGCHDYWNRITDSAVFLPAAAALPPNHLKSETRRVLASSHVCHAVGAITLCCYRADTLAGLMHCKTAVTSNDDIDASALLIPWQGSCSL